MPLILGYLRTYKRWNGDRGLTSEQQKEIVNRIAHKLDGGEGPYYVGRSYHTETAGGAKSGWPVLKKLVKRAREDAELGTVLVIPTLDGVRLNATFLGLLAARECDGAPMSWLYGPLLTQPLARKMDQSRRFDGSDFEKAVDIIRAFNPKQVYVYAMGQEPWLTFLTSIIVAGTNGKGSTSATLTSILTEAGYRAAHYTSPHLVDLREPRPPGRVEDDCALRVLTTVVSTAVGSPTCCWARASSSVRLGSPAV